MKLTATHISHELEPGMIVRVHSDQDNKFEGEFIVTRCLDAHKFRILPNNWWNRLRYFLHLC